MLLQVHYWARRARAVVLWRRLFKATGFGRDVAKLGQLSLDLRAQKLRRVHLRWHRVVVPTPATHAILTGLKAGECLRRSM